jgi:hypothetical protein
MSKCLRSKACLHKKFVFFSLMTFKWQIEGCLGKLENKNFTMYTTVSANSSVNYTLRIILNKFDKTREEHDE